jgi:hypothetical protein
MKARAMTRVELLILIVMLGLVCAMIPACHMLIGRQAHKASCNSNLRNIITGMKIYANANDRFFPTVFDGRSGETWREDWPAGDPEARISDHGLTAEVEFKDTDPFTNNTSALWLLVRDGTVNPRQLVCPEAQGYEPYFPRADASGAGDDVSHWWSFKQLKNCSYSYQNTLRRPVRDGIMAHLIILADANPLRADHRDITRAQRRPAGVEDWQMNSPNHGFSGQNVVDMSGAVYWITEPIGNKGNNIWVKSEWDRGRLMPEDGSCYADKNAHITQADDEWLVP